MKQGKQEKVFFSDNCIDWSALNYYTDLSREEWSELLFFCQYFDKSLRQSFFYYKKLKQGQGKIFYLGNKKSKVVKKHKKNKIFIDYAKNNIDTKKTLE